MDAVAPPRRRFRLLKWLGTMVCAILLFATGFCLIFSSLVYADGYRVYGLFAGSVGVEHGRFAETRWILGNRWDDWKDLAKHWKVWIHGRQRPEGLVLWIPLWIPLAAIGVPSAWFWYLDRRRPAPGACRCGYDLTGNSSGVCPECGTPTKVSGAR